MSSIASKITAILLSILLLSYIGYQVFTSLYDPYESEVVFQGTYTYDVDLDGFFVRNEVALQQGSQGVISYRFKNGEKIPKQTVVANIYNKEEDLYNIKAVEKLNQQKNLLVQAQDQQGMTGLQLDVLSNQINAFQNEIIKQVDDGDLSNLEKSYENLMLNMNKIAVFIDNTVNYNSAIAGIDSQIESYKAKIPDNTVDVSAEQSGYFSNYVDGYESVFTTDILKNLTVKNVQARLKNQEVRPSNNIGKIQLDANWYFVSIVKTKEIESFKEGQVVNIKFDSKSTKKVATTVSQIITEKDSENSVVVFADDTVDEDFITMRFEKPKAIIDNHNGILIPKEAIRFSKVMKTQTNEETGEITEALQDVKGVYTLFGQAVRFKEVDIVYEDSFITVSRPNIKSNYVTVYDRVITKGKDLNGTK